MISDNTGIDETVELDESGDLKYPAHIESFETYYYLGENRSLKEAALIRFQALVPNCPQDDQIFNDQILKAKFDSFYKKVKRWAAKENWPYWISKKETEESHKRRDEVTEINKSLFKAVRSYQDLVRQSLAIFAEKASLPFLLKQALERGDTETEKQIRDRIERGEGVEIRKFREAKEMIELDVYLTNILAQHSQNESPSEAILSEEEADKLDKIMEFFRREAMKSSGGKEID